MVDSNRGITNLHVPSDVIVDASMPAMIRTSGHMWGPDGDEHDTLAVIPDSSYAGIYQVVIDDCRAHGAYDPTTMGSVPNVGFDGAGRRGIRLPRQNLRNPHNGTVQVVDRHRHDVLLETPVAAGDIWRMCQTKDVADPGLGQTRRHPRPRHRNPGRVLARHRPRPRRHPDHQSRTVSGRPRHRRPGHLHQVPGRRDRLHPAPDPPRPRHHLGHRQRPARLPDRPVPHPRTRHLRQNAVRGAPDQRRRPLRNRRRRLRPQTRPTTRQRKLPALGQPRRIPRPRRQPRTPRRHHQQPPSPSPRRHPRPGHRHLPRTKTNPPPAGSAASTTAAATTTSPYTGPKNSPPKPTTPPSPPPSPTSQNNSPTTKPPSPTNSSPSKAPPPTSAATTAPTTPKPPPS